MKKDKRSVSTRHGTSRIANAAPYILGTEYTESNYSSLQDIALYCKHIR
jgi:hypothetical protein